MKPVAPGAWLGLLGGGQLGRMFTMAAQSMGYRVVVVDPGSHSPAGSVADDHLRADYLDPDALDELGRRCAAVTTEFENVPAEALRRLATHCVVSPSADSVAVAQDRIREKRFLAGVGLGTAPFAVIEQSADLDALDPSLLPGILKRARFGYDGKGQARVATPAQARAAFEAMGGEPCVLEQKLDLALEISVVVARGFDDEVRTFPVAENAHAHGILDVSVVPARISAAQAQAARDATVRVAEALDYRGVLCVEYFILQDGRLLANEIAPRPHNSGHYTIDGCFTSQFEQQARVMCGLPLGDTALHGPAVMVNLLGDVWAAGEPDWIHVLRHPRAKLHLYGKTEARPGRKMGHFTVLGDDVAATEVLARAIKARLDADAAAVSAARIA
ncbi:MAG: 5-(carboxyamino)imidazole ribonucleotide synthase [Burkholderiales bacterium]|nr:5-(carboxyamino)imidazole ribonucleotide synthase [Burkholderiales bacterium]